VPGYQQQGKTPEIKCKVSLCQTILGARRKEKLELKKYNLARHYGVDPDKITPEFVKTFNREKPRTIRYNTFKALSTYMKLTSLRVKKRGNEKKINT